MKSEFKIEHKTSGYGKAMFRIVDVTNNVKGPWTGDEYAAHLRTRGKLYVAFSDFYDGEFPTERVLVLASLTGEPV